MFAVFNDFEVRVKEVEIYFNHLNLIFNKDAEIFLPLNLTRKTRKIDGDLKKVLKANCFLIIYNLVESSIRQSLIHIYEEISSQQLSYEMVIDEVKKIWIYTKYKNFKGKGNDEIFDIITSISNDIIQITFEDKRLGGSIDSMKIRNIANELGFSFVTHFSLKSGEKLHIVKTQRNKLAHGEISFSSCGRDYTLEDLVKIKEQTIKFIRRILENIKIYIDNKKFQV